MSEDRTHPVVKVIIHLLRERRISKSEFARRLGWGRMQVQRRLAGDAEITVAELEQIAEVLDVPAMVLLDAERVS